MKAANKKMSKQDLFAKYCDELLQVKKDLKEGNYDASDRYTERDILRMKEDLLMRITGDMM